MDGDIALNLRRAQPMNTALAKTKPVRGGKLRTAEKHSASAAKDNSTHRRRSDHDSIDCPVVLHSQPDPLSTGLEIERKHPDGDGRNSVKNHFGM